MNSEHPIVKNQKTGKEELNGEFIINMGNKLDIADANIFVLRNPDKMYKELVLSYKTIYLNTYNITVLDISQTDL